VTRLLLDQGLPRRTAALLSQAGYTCLHVGDLGLSAAPDSEIVERALALDSTVVTLDSDFAGMIARTKTIKPSLVHLRLQHLNVQAATELLLHILPQVTDDLTAGAIVVVTPRGVRVRRLPLPGVAHEKPRRR
jgi:predicted nuclease of predicted toxin-antitoxin system